MVFLIAGLGNIGDEYKNTRHNTGFLILDHIAQKEGFEFQTGRYANYAEFKIKNAFLYFIKPTTYMNNSGKAIRYWLNYLGITVAELLIIVDDLALPTGKFRIKEKGGDGGHNGLISITEYIQTTEYPRLRMGIGNEFNKGQQVDYVLGEWKDEEYQIIQGKLPLVYDAVKSFVFEGIGRAMTKYNNN